MMKLTLRELECLVKICETSSFIDAASELNLSQPTLSAHIANLEKKLNSKLLHRSRTGIKPTTAGKTVYQEACDILGRAIAIENSISDLSTLKSGTLKIGGSTIPGTYFLPKKIKQFKKLYPDIDIKLIIKDSEEVITDIQKKSIDVGFVGYPPPKNLYSKPVFSDEIIVAVNKNHPWFKKNNITIDSLLKEPLLIREAGSGTRKSFLNILRNKTNKNIKIFSVLGSTEVIKQSIFAGLAPGIISKKAVLSELKKGQIKEVKIKDMVFKRSFYMVLKYYRSASFACKEFIKLFE